MNATNCRRQHQNACEGPAVNGLCTKHAEVWAAMQTDWELRAQEAAKQAGRRTYTTPIIRRDAWTPEEDAIAINAGTWKEAKRHLPERTVLDVQERRRQLGATTITPWKSRENNIIRTSTFDEAVARLPRRSRQAISKRRTQLGVTDRFKTGRAVS